ncbi:hypothetical protein PRBRB14_25750 [Hallella multisaccharivorax DSM 17128]|uniref:Uncharacterized protein n=1 Tax=Hallella multisaccharivorax DSM 17128 TaxID=688246 RepID=F8N637_9BACT|nr:hypothetical protein [Hallella multisaccharivorax]EGN58210.1 hypothetical protein Premu_2865 [Hallella multisaccharivorax DSM 17128]GJG31696.1 hypothetical protein PRBRB14_25750 [Hallella multisaccharivorax DSM 17128]
MQRTLAYISLLLCLFLSQGADAQHSFPTHDGDRQLYNAFIETPKGQLTGLCMLLQDEDSIKGAIVNEFGVSALDFVYSIKDDQLRLRDVMAMMDKWYIRKVLEADLKHVLHALKQGQTQWMDERYKIKYTFTPIDNSQDQDNDGTELPD